jgi:hypothetical protein
MVLILLGNFINTNENIEKPAAIRERECILAFNDRSQKTDRHRADFEKSRG